MEIALALLLLGSPPPATASACDYDAAAFLRLDPRSFDQDASQGWRSLEARGCYGAAADSIASYRRANNPTSTSLFFHEAQMRAYAGDYEAALALLPSSKKRLDYFGWNAYVDATSAFLSRDIARLRAARENLLRTPTPDSHPWFDENGQEIPAFPWTRGDPWPHNLHVVDALIRCFHLSYREAYSSSECSARR